MVDDVVGVDVGGDGLAGAFVRDQLAGGGEVDAVDVWVSVEGSVMFRVEREVGRKSTAYVMEGEQLAK